jgi:hypothetical protein
MNRLVVLAMVVTACGMLPPPKYPFGSAATIVNPTHDGRSEPALAVAADGFSQHQLVSFSAEQACFMSQLDGPESVQVQAMKFTLRGFQRADADLRKVQEIVSDTTAVQETSVRLTSSGTASPVSVVKICFSAPTRVITPTTQWMVLAVAGDGTNDDHHDGVWQLTQ